MKYIFIPIVLIIIAAVAVLSFTVGKNGFSFNKSTSLEAPASQNIALTPTTAILTKKVTGGGILAFPKYEITVNTVWQETKESENEDSEKVIVSKDDYQISITQGGFGGAACLYPGDPDIEGPSARYDYYKEITTLSGDFLRRSWTGTELASKGFGICQKTQYGWQAPTLYGHIAFLTPVTKMQNMLDEMDNILASLKKI